MSEKVNTAPWLRFAVELQMTGRFAASLPRTEKEIRAMLEHRMPARKPENARSIDTLVAGVMEEVGITTEDAEGWLPSAATFPRNEDGLYYEGRCIRGHLKDCATQVAQKRMPMLHGANPNYKNFRSKLTNRLYVENEIIPLDRKEPDGTETRYIQVMTAQGPRSSIKYIDYVNQPTLSFVVRLYNDGLYGIEDIREVLLYGSIHGMGQERGQDWGRYEIVRLEQIT